MAQLTINKTWADGETPTKADLDNIVDGYETFLNVTQLAADNIQANSITASSTFSNGSITAGKIANGAITTAKILDGAITASKIMDGAITTAKILDANVTTAKIADSTIDPSKFGTNSITPSKLYDAVNSDGIQSNAISTGSFAFLDTNTNTSGLTGYVLTTIKLASDVTLYDTSYTTSFNPKATIDISLDTVSVSRSYVAFNETMFDAFIGTWSTTCQYPSGAFKHITLSKYSAPSLKIGIRAETPTVTSQIGSGKASLIEVQ